ncbi:MAG: hypothetical protein M1828_005902 [Chrysothrix sp. TS-e1954]|nr:MAG: hypothetical protein M1828_005902 [Chrysothrix sp. TS-e1954]
MAQELARGKLFDVSFMTAIVTGGGGGIGLAIAKALAVNGAKVYIVGRRPDVLEQAVKGSEVSPGSLHALPADVSQKDEVKRLAEIISDREPNGIQLLVNNAGVARDLNTHFSSKGQPDWKDPSAISTFFMQSDPSHWTETFSINVTAGFFMAMAFLPLLAKGQASVPNYTSSVVNVSSISAVCKDLDKGQIAYATSKAAFSHLTRILATAFLDTGVRVNTISPGTFPTDMTRGKSNLVGSPTKREGCDSDIAASILFLASRGGTFYNHQEIYPDGGTTLVEPAAV